MQDLFIDLETYSDVDLKKSGLYKYVQSPNFQILLFAYSYGGDTKIFDMTAGDDSSEGFKSVIDALQDPSVKKHAFNAAFEWYCLNKFFPSPIEQWECSMVHALYCGFPGSLAAVGEAMGLGSDKKKMGVGMSLIRTFCVPVTPTKNNGFRTRILPEHEPERWRLFKDYCVRDVVTEMEIDRRLDGFPMPEKEQRLWQLDQLMNASGVAVDEDLINKAVTIHTESANALLSEAIAITGKSNPKSVKQLTEWLEGETEATVADLTKATVSGMLSGEIKSDSARRVLEIRQQLSKTSVKKYAAMQASVCADGRVRGLLQFYGANRTGRWAGRLVQVQNLPRNKSELLEFARRCVKANKKDALEYVFASVPDIISQLIRTGFVAPEGKLLYVADFSAIEARVIAWLADEQWRLQVFATHGKIYEASASSMFSVPIEKIVKGNPEYELRAKGKVAELALGYQGASGALIAMGALNMGLKEEELPEIVSRWRGANERIVDLWYKIENAAFHALKTGCAGTVKGIIFKIESDGELDFLTITLPSKRKLFYAKPFIQKNERNRDALFYYGLNQETKKWGIQSTYGGKLTENITQAIARDCLAESMMRLAENGYQIVMHVHDEVIIEHSETNSENTIKYICGLMGEPIDWAPGLLLRAEGFTNKYYKKE